MKRYLIIAALLTSPTILMAQTSTKPMTGMDMPKTQPMGQGNMNGMSQGSMGMGGMGAMMKNTPANPYAESEMAMHHSMMMAKGDDASETWTRKMIEHHRGAIAMSKIAMSDAKDAETRKMAEKSNASQTLEIAGLQSWLKRHGKAAQ